MRILSAISIVCVLLTACTSGDEVNGRSIKTANRSVNMIKDRLPIEKRIEFEVSYWTLRDAIKNRDEFLDKVGGNTAEELIVLGKEVFQQRKKDEFKQYNQYNSWEEMIASYAQERLDQDKPKNQNKRDRDNNVLYQL